MHATSSIPTMPATAVKLSFLRSSKTMLGVDQQYPPVFYPWHRVCRYGVPDVYENSVHILGTTILAGAGYLDSRQRGRGRQSVHRAIALKPTMSKHRSGHKRYGVYFLFSRLGYVDGITSSR
jgi:hypothetical protein